MKDGIRGYDFQSSMMFLILLVVNESAFLLVYVLISLVQANQATLHIAYLKRLLVTLKSLEPKLRQS